MTEEARQAKIKEIQTFWEKQRNKSYLPANNYQENPSLDQSTLEAYERYVMAQFKFQEQNDIQKEREDAINSLIPGTKHYYHLYFLDVMKRRPQLEDFTLEEASLFLKFAQKFSSDVLYLEVQTYLLLVNPMEKLPKMSDSLDLDDRKKYIDIIKLVNERYLKADSFGHSLESQCSEYLVNHRNDQVEESGDDEAAGGQGSEAQFEDPFKVGKTREELVKDKQAELDEMAKQETVYGSSSLYGYENDLNWSEYPTKHIIKHAEDKGSASFFEIISSSYFEKLCQFFDENYKEFYSVENQNKTKQKQQKYSTSSYFFSKFTIEQLDLFRKLLRDKGYNIQQEDKNFVYTYFAKVFSLELSEDYQETLTYEEKLTNLKGLYAYAKANQQPESLRLNLLHEILTLTIRLDQYDEALFKEYLKYPLERNEHLKRDEDKEKNSGAHSMHTEWKDCLQYVLKNTNDRFVKQSWWASKSSDVIPKYLEHICQVNNGSLEEYEDDFNEHYLQSISKKVKVFLSDKGLMDMPDSFDPNEFKRIQDEVIIRFKETNKDQFSVNESVNLILELKNIPELIIKVFQFNTVTYYKKNLEQFDTSINLEGMVPYIQKTEKEMFKDVPKNKILTKQFDFEELKDQAGLFIIEFLGNGKTSRVIIKKGSLTLIHRSTPAGHIGYIIDEDKNICKSETTGVWIEKKFYRCNVENNGQIFIPYGTSYGTHTIILIHNDFAQLGEFTRNTESYSFKTNFHLNSEQMLVGQEAQILVRPRLYINGRKANSNLLQNCQVTLEIGDYIEDRESTKTYDDLTFSDDQETIISFQVPPNMSRLSLAITAQVQNVTLKKLESFSDSQSFPIQQHSTSTRISEVYLRRINKLYYIYALGRNGEPQTNQKIKVYAKRSMKFNKETMEKELQTDKQGKVCVGELINVDYVGAYLVTERFGESWNICNNHIDTWTQETGIDIIEGENVVIPINFDDSTPLQRHQASLQMTRNGNILKNLFAKIQLIKAQCGLYHIIKLEGLEAGEYQLELNIVAGQTEKIDITVHKGTYWQGSFILKKNCLIESSAQKNAIRIEEVKVVPAEPAGSSMSIQLTNFSKDSRMHIYGTQFMPNISDSLSKQIAATQNDTTSKKEGCFGFPCWTNIYESNHTVSDEVRYILNRQKKGNKMGNTLDRPTLLMKPNKLQTTQTDEEVLNKGDEFQKHDLYLSAKQADCAYYGGRGAAMLRKCKMAAPALHQIPPQSNIIKDYQNFLNCAPLQLFNLKADDKGIINVNIENIENYSQLFLIGCDSDTVVQRQIDVHSLLQSSSMTQIPKRDLTVNKMVEENEEVGLIEARTTEKMKKGDNVHIEDITSSKIQIIDDMEKVYQVMEQLKGIGNLQPNLAENTQFKELYKILLPWNTFDFKKKCALFSKHTCHELNFFLFKRDKEFFDHAVKLLVQNKLDKTFMDNYLLAMDLADANNDYGKEVLSYIDFPNKLVELNALEKSLVIQFCLAKGSEEEKKKAKSFAKHLSQQLSEAEKADNHFTNANLRNRMFDTVLNAANLDQPDESTKQLEQIQQIKVKEEMQRQLQAVQKKEEAFRKVKEVKEVSQMRKKSNQAVKSKKRSMAVQEECLESNQMMQMDMMMDECAEDVDMGGLFGGDDDYGDCAPQAMTLSAMRAPSNQLFSKMDAQITQQRQVIANNVGFKEMDQTSEYMETHYLGVKSASSQTQYYTMNRLFRDYQEYLVENEGKSEEEKTPFLTDSFIDINLMFVPFAFALIDLPLQGSSSQCHHKFKPDQGRGIEITAGKHAILFKKEIKEGQCQLRKDMRIMNRYLSLINYSEDDDEVEDMLINHPYQCEIIMTNISTKSKEVTLSFQIPNGSLPLKKTKFIESKSFSLGPYTTLKTTQQFYFPSDGSFDHAPSNISQEQLVTCKSGKRVLVIGKKRIIKNVVTFKDMMVTCKNDEERKQKILDLYENNYEMLGDEKFQYDEGVERYFASQDTDFFVSMLELIHKNVWTHDILRLFSRHYESIFTDDKFKNQRSLILKTVKNLMNSDEHKQNSLIKYVLRPIDTDLMEVQTDQLNTHLEYFPMVNQRAFSLPGQGGADLDDSGQGLKQILNVQFRKTYQKFMHLLLHQNLHNSHEINLDPKFRIQLAFYLQLQDRVEEALKVFNTIDQQDSDLINLGYDYMQAYFEFFKCEDQEGDEATRFEQLKQIVAKYQDCPIDRFKIIFAKLKEQLDEIDEAREMKINSSKKEEEIDANQNEEIGEEQLRKARKQKMRSEPIIHDVSMDEQTGTLTIESVNIEKLTIKYYLIDAEILFSRSPFVNDQASHFSYVTPYKALEQQANMLGEPTQVALPTDLKGKNMVIEINSDDLQEFKTFYSCQLKVQFIEKFGELRVFKSDTMQPLSKVYCKVYSKNKNGRESFFRDGFTDIRGKFEYANASGQQLKDVNKFSIFISDDENKNGSTIKEVGPPEMEEEDDPIHMEQPQKLPQGEYGNYGDYGISDYGDDY